MAAYIEAMMKKAKNAAPVHKNSEQGKPGQQMGPAKPWSAPGNVPKQQFQPKAAFHQMGAGENGGTGDGNDSATTTPTLPSTAARKKKALSLLQASGGSGPHDGRFLSSYYLGEDGNPS